MIDGYLKFSSRAAAEAAFATLGTGLFDGAVELDGLRLDMCIINGSGSIQRPTGATVVDEFGTPTPEFAPVPGFHVNVRFAGEELPSALLPFHLTPATPKCVWG
jgi:hypothetical protein